MPADTSPAFASARARFLEGVAALESGEPAAAEVHLLASLQDLPGRPSTLVNLALARLQLGRPDEALPPLDAALAADPAQADAWCHRARAGLALGRDDTALADLARAQALAPLPPAMRCLQATLLNRLGRHGKALAVLQALLAEAPAVVSTAVRAEAELLRGHTLQALGRPAEALAAYTAATEADPADPEAWLHRGLLLAESGQPEAARAALHRAEAAGGDPALLAFLTAPLPTAGPAAAASTPAAPGAADTPVPPAAPAHYLRLLFDPYAERFDEHLLHTLRYRGHEAVAAAAAAARPASAPPITLVLDLGCGSGLCGPLLRPLARRVEGVDLSPTMVRLARTRGCYDAVHEAELLPHLQALAPGQTGLVVAADVFIYIGELAPVFAEVARALQPGGLFVFSVEAAAAGEGPGAPGYVLRRSLRYAHTGAGLRQRAQAAGLQVLGVQPVVLREEQRQPVAGEVWVLQAAG